LAVIVDKPPNFDIIVRAFPDATKPGVLFAYGEDIYNPSGQEIPPALLAHEQVHAQRQLAVAHEPRKGVTAWWDLYIADTEFRYQEELFAHAAEFKAQAARLMDRNLRAKLLQSTALRLVAPLYNYQPPRTLGQAMRDLRWELDR
jgi:hypothetical protein